MMYGVDAVRPHPKERPVSRRQFDCMIPGDVVVLGRNKRVVRQVRRDRWGCVRCIEVIKLRRSGLPSPCTIILRSEMYPGGNYRFGGIIGRHRLCGVVPLECETQAQIDAGITGSDCRVTERDVVGLLR